MEVIRYDTHFNINEWYTIGTFCMSVLLVVILPKRFPKKMTAVYLMCGVFFGFFFDHTLSVLPVSFYDINDRSTLEVMDFLSHLVYGPFSYFFFYLYDYFKIKPRFSPVYVLAWATVSVALELLSGFLGVFHYLHGYTIYYSFVIYLIVQSIWVALYYIFQRYGEKEI